MTTILHVKSSSNLQSSFSRQIGTFAVQELRTANPSAKVIERDLVKNTIPHLSPEWLGAAFSGNADAPEMELSNTLVNELFASDIIVIEAPMYNFGIPSVLKAWIDHVVRAGKTFRYTANGSEGLLINKKAILVVSRGGIYSENPYKAMDYQEVYLRAILGFIGITDVEPITIEGVALGTDKVTEALEKAKARTYILANRAA